jgi:adenosine deaminase
VGAIEGAWCGEDRRKALLEKVEEWAEKHKGLV